jgi:hypothetical protein
LIKTALTLLIGGFIFGGQGPGDNEKKEAYDPLKVAYVKMGSDIAEQSSYQDRPEVWAGIVKDCESSPERCKCFPLRNATAAK